MPQEVNILDPLGIAKAVRSQVNQMATRVNLPQVPVLPAVNVRTGALPPFKLLKKIPDRPGMSRGDRAG